MILPGDKYVDVKYNQDEYGTILSVNYDAGHPQGTYTWSHWSDGSETFFIQDWIDMTPLYVQRIN